jgi:glycosyltransferase involved in cell wall biosynthesis
MPKVSVCMVTYNHGKLIREAIDGVLAQQTDFDVELIIGNDRSSDETDSVINEILQNHPQAHRIKYFNHAENKGMMRNFGFVLEQCTGQYIARCDGDDYWTDPLKLQKQVDFLDHHLDYSICFHKAKILKPNGDVVSDYITKIPEQHETIEDLVLWGNFIHTVTVMYRNVIDGLPFEFYNSPIGDFFVHIMVARHGKIKLIHQEMAVYRQGVGFLSQQQEINSTFNLVRFYSCVLSYLDEDHLLKVIYERQMRVVDSYNSHAKYKFSSTAYLAKSKSLIQILKVIAKKIVG